MLLLITATIMGLTAGIFYCWSVSVTRGLAPLPDREYITAFQSLNREIQNPLFFLCFFGSAVLLPVSAWQQYDPSLPPRFWLLLAASIAYILGVIVLTIAGNVPLNEALDTFNTQTATVEEISARRTTFEGPWNRLNNIRTVVCIVCLLLTILACLVKDNIREFKLP